MSSEDKKVCKACGGDLERFDKLPIRPAIEVHKFRCVDCGLESRVEVDIRFG